jgi:hypothetical protein
MESNLAFTIDFVSVAIGYIVGVGLCYTTMHMIYALENEDNDA